MSAALRWLASAFTLFSVALLAEACSGVREPCARVSCAGARTCNPTTGACELPSGYDAGSTAGGSATVDAGPTCTPACAAGQVCDPSGRCVQCLTEKQCSCPTPRCVLGTCVPDETDAGAVTVTAADTCALAPTVTACGPKRFEVAVDLAGQGGGLSLQCAAADAGSTDAVFNLVLGSASDVRVQVSKVPGTTSQPVAALRATCAVDADLACVDSQGLVGSFRLRRLQPGTYSVVLAGYDRSGSGPTLASVDVLDPTGSTNETCLQAQPLDLDGGTVRVDLVGADDDVQVPCNANAASPDLFYRVTLTQPSDLIVTATGTAGQRPVLSLRSAGCRFPTQLGCNAASTSAGRLVARRLIPGDYTLVVETPGPVTQGRIELTASAQAATIAPSNDSCALPRDLVFPSGQNELTAQYDTSLGVDDTKASCGGEGSPDLVFRLTVPVTGTYTFTATPDPLSNGAPVMSLRKADCGATTDVACVAASALNAPVTFTATLPPDVYLLWLDATQASTAGPLTLNVRRQ